MTQQQATAEVFWTAYQALNRSEREAFIAKLMQDERLSEDLHYAVAVRSRKKEPTASLEDYLSARAKKK